MRASFVAAALALGGCCLGASAPTAPAAPSLHPPPASPEQPVGSPGFCPGDDLTHVPLATSDFVSTLPLAVARQELDARNSICGDTWCEGSFEWYAYDLRSDGSRSELTQRTYSFQRGTVADVSTIEVRGPHYVGRVLGQHVVPSCTTPCLGFAVPPRWAPCLALDLRCELDLPAPAGPGVEDLPWEEAMIACGIALESAIRARVPEQFPDPE
ncbi:MAG: hypothetical protein U0234_09885 [Sandaracinus sp.]